MPESYTEFVNRVLRDHEGYTGDGKGGVGELPVGDRSTARKPMDKRDIRQVVLAGETAVQTAVDAAAAAAQSASNATGAAIDVQGATLYAADLDALLANTATSYPVGTVFGTRREGFSFEVVSSNPTLTTAGGVGLRPAQKPRAFYIDEFRRGSDVSWSTTALRAIEEMRAAGGGKLIWGARQYDMGPQLSVWATGGQPWNMVFEGHSPGGTILQFDSALSGNDGIALMGGSNTFGLKDMTIRGASRYGVNTAGSIATTSTSIFTSRLNFARLIIEGCGSHGFRSTNGWKVVLDEIISRRNGGWGLHLFGGHTSVALRSCWAGGPIEEEGVGNALGGWRLNGLLYSYSLSCAADANLGPAYHLTNSPGFIFIAGGAESNAGDGMLVNTGTADAAHLSEMTRGMDGLQIYGFTTTYNGKNTGTAQHLRIVSADGQAATITECGSRGRRAGTTETGIILQGASGLIDYKHDAVRVEGGIIQTGTAIRTNRSVIGKVVTAKISAAQSVQNDTDTLVSLDTLVSNTLVGTLNSNLIVIPDGVSRVRITAGVFWGASSTGVRLARVTRNGQGVDGLPQVKQTAAGADAQSIVSAVFAVTPGDTIGLRVQHTAGAALDLVANGSTFLSVEAMG